MHESERMNAVCSNRITQIIIVKNCTLQKWNGSTGSRVTGSLGQRFCPGRVGSWVSTESDPTRLLIYVLGARLPGYCMPSMSLYIIIEYLY